jgi:Zn-dependent metalloprotease
MLSSGEEYMFEKLIPALLLLISAQALAVEFPLEISEYFDDIRIVAYVNQSDIDKEARWTPFRSAPPLSVEAALDNVQTHLKADNVFADAELTSIELKPIPKQQDYWHYLVKMKYTQDGISRPHFFVVLMDGKVISALKQPDSIK